MEINKKKRKASRCLNDALNEEKQNLKENLYVKVNVNVLV